jgi:hypothetical protein
MQKKRRRYVKDFRNATTFIPGKTRRRRPGERSMKKGLAGRDHNPLMECPKCLRKHCRCKKWEEGTGFTHDVNRNVERRTKIKHGLRLGKKRKPNDGNIDKSKLTR